MYLHANLSTSFGYIPAVIWERMWGQHQEREARERKRTEQFPGNMWKRMVLVACLLGSLDCFPGFPCCCLMGFCCCCCCCWWWCCCCCWLLLLLLLTTLLFFLLLLFVVCCWFVVDWLFVVCCWFFVHCFCCEPLWCGLWWIVQLMVWNFLKVIWGESLILWTWNWKATIMPTHQVTQTTEVWFHHPYWNIHSSIPLNTLHI